MAFKQEKEEQKSEILNTHLEDLTYRFNKLEDKLERKEEKNKAQML